MDVVEFFNPHDHDHLRAWSHLNRTGTWPENFIPEDITFSPVWRFDLTLKMAECWVSHALTH